jgi:hypothetical protein
MPRMENDFEIFKKKPSMRLKGSFGNAHETSAILNVILLSHA